MKNTDLTQNDIDIIINPENENTKEISNRKLQFNRLTRASEAARKQPAIFSDVPKMAALN